MSKELEALEEAKELTHRLITSGSWDKIEEQLNIVETALKRLEDYEGHTTFTMVNQISALADENKGLRKQLNQMYESRDRYNLDQRKLQAFKIIKECVGLKMTTDGDVGCLYVPIVKCFQPLEQNIVVVGCVNDKEKIDLLKEVLL